MVTACVLIIGNEILCGRTKDANLPFLATELNKLGIQVGEARILPDKEDIIVNTLQDVRRRFDYIFTTGGIGPTHDDITSACVAKAVGRKLIRNHDAVAMLESHYSAGDLNEARLRMADTPEGAALIENPISKAPGYQVENIFVLAGVPRIAQAMFDNLEYRLKGGETVQSRTLSTNLGEGLIADGLGGIQDRFRNVEIGSYPYFKDGQLGVSLVIRGFDNGEIDECCKTIEELIDSLDGNLIFSS